jgi:RNA polymerase sigma factor (sigma-70 family)
MRRDPFSDPEELIRRVYAYVAYRIGDGADAEDATAEAIERAVRYKQSFDDQKGEPAAWVIGIARRVLASRQSLEYVGPQDDVPSGEDLVEDVVRRASLRTAVERLAERDRELVALRYGADLTAREIAGLLDMEVNAVEVALHRAIGRLRSMLSDDGSLRSRPVAQPVAD